MSTFTGKSKATQGTFTKKTKNVDTWTNLKHSAFQIAGFDNQTFDSTSAFFDTAGNVITTQWTTKNKEIG